MIRRAFRRPPPRRGAILLVVLGMLALFAVVGLSFVLYAESEATGARNSRAARNELADPDPAVAGNQFLAQLIFDTDANSPLWGHSLARSRFGVAGTQSPYTGTGFPFGTSVTLSGATMDQTQVVNYRAAFLAGGTSPDAWNKAVPYTYPDRNNFHLAYYDPVTDRVTVPSFHRQDLFGSLDPTNANWTNADGFFKTLRPRQAQHPAFPTVPMNADGTYTGDVANLKFLGLGSQQNDSLWMDIGLPVQEWRGRRYKALVAPIVLDLGGRIDLRLAGNNMSGGAHGSHHGWGPWSINPTPAANPTVFLAGGAAELQNLIGLRYNIASPPPTGLDLFRNLSTGTLNYGLMPRQYSRIDASGTGTGAVDPMTLPAAGGFSPFPTYSQRFAASQSNAAVPPTLDSQLGVNPAAVHPQAFSPYQWTRRQNPALPANNAWVPSLEDQLRLQLRTGGPKGPTGYAGQFNPSPRLTTLFSASQRWGEMQVPVDNTGTNFARLAAIDITRPLPDYRTNPAVQLSPANFGNFVAARIGRQNLARDIFVRLVAANFLIDGTNVAYNPTTGYLMLGGMANVPDLQFWAQYAANMVDQIDSDDVCTSFVWNPVDPTQSDVNDTTNAANLPNFATASIATHTVFGTELPKLVLNEAYCMLNNSRRDSLEPPNSGPPAVPPVGLKPNRDNLLKRYWIELHNPLSIDPTMADSGAARLRYDPATTMVPDQTGAAVAAPFGSNVYQIEVAEVPAGMAGAPVQPYTAFLATTPLGEVANYVTTPVPGMTHKIILNDYTPNNPQPMGGLMMGPTDATNLVPPANGGAGPMGYFLIGPQDLFPATPAGSVANNLCVNDPPAMPMGPVNSLSYDTGTRRPTGNAAPTPDPTTTTSVILLRRLANPYLPAQPDPTVPNYNPYMTVDFLENVPTRDRAQFDETNDRTAGGWTASAAATIGRKHPYAAAPVYNPAAMAAPFPAVVDQNPAMPAMPPATTPPHTFLAANSANNPANLDNAAGLAWLAHLDREPVNQFELLSTSVVSPAQLTQKFYNPALGQYQGHITLAATGAPPFLDTTGFPNAYRALDLLSVGSRLPGVPLGGREPGRVNANAAGDPAILQAVLDPQSGTRFDATFVANAWAALLPSRTPGNAPTGANNLPAATTAEGGADRPFQPLFGIQETLLRQGATPNYPALFNAAAGNHLVPQTEPLTKGWNNLTTVSDGFLVVFTVGYFEVDVAGRLGKELQDKVAGDLRTQYAGIVDRSAITMNIADPTSATPLAVQPTILGPKPWETKLAGDSLPGSNSVTIQAFFNSTTNTATVYDDGTPVTIQASNTLWIGYAMANPTNAAYANPTYTAGTPQAADGDGEAVLVTGVSAGATPGTAVLTVQTVGGGNLTRFHGGGNRVSNAPVGHPGPQPLFDYREPTGRYRGVLPYFMRMVP